MSYTTIKIIQKQYYFCMLRFVKRKTEINSESRIPTLNVLNITSILVKQLPHLRYVDAG